jgi:hypothetical protein
MEWQSAGSKIQREEGGLGNDEKITSLFQPDFLLSAQYFGNLRKTLLEPEKKLMFAILEDAISCYQNNLTAHTVRGKRFFEETKSWIVAVGNDWIFSFENVCEALGLNPQYVRQGLLRWAEKYRQKHFDREAWKGRKLAG